MTDSIPQPQNFSLFNQEFKQDLEKLQTFTDGLSQTKINANKMFHIGKYQQAEQEFKKIMDTFQDFIDNFGLNSGKDQDVLGPKSEQSQGQGGQSQKLIGQTNIYEMYSEAHLNMAICQIKQQSIPKLKDAVVTLTSILKYIGENNDSPQQLAKVYYLRGKALYLLKYFQHATNDLNQSKILYKGQFQSEIDQLLAIVKKNQQIQPKSNQSNFTGFDISRAKQSQLVKRISHHQLLGGAPDVPNRISSFQKELRTSDQLICEQEASGDQHFKTHTKRGGLIQNYELGTEIDEIINLKKPRKLKILKMIFSILKHFFRSMYFFLVLLVIWLMRSYWIKSKIRPEEIKGKFL